MRTSLIVTTYNWKEALEITLRSIARQSEPPDEVVIADDGSRPDTGKLVHEWASRLSMPLLHVWQDDLGFRLARARNCAIAASRGEYIVIVDGDMSLHRHFIADHKRAARRGFFIQGARAFTTPNAGKRMLEEGILDMNIFSPGVRRRRHAIHNRLFSWMAYQFIRTDQKAIRGSNQAYWKDDLVSVNGFNEEMIGWGGEDNEIAARLYNSGIRRRNLKFAGLAIHLYHNSRKPVGENPNHAILKATIETRKTRCKLGLDQHVHNLIAVKDAEPKQ
jgi:glycosyltransferase involved in cell wall biosynthesis